MSSTCAIALGSNLGHRLDNLDRAIKKLSCFLKSTKLSTVYETHALLPNNAPESWNLPYLNMVVTGQSTLDPFELLSKLKQIEHEMGRDLKNPRWSPRIIDCDLLYCGDQVIETASLTLPHPELFNRFFTVVPGASLDPTWQHPKNKITLARASEAFRPYSTHFTRSMALYPKLMGIVNITPDSFSDGGQFLDPQAAILHATGLYQGGAYVIDFGAQSINPQSKPLSWQEEWQRLEPVLSGFTSKEYAVKISIDTAHYEVAKRATAQYPVDWINTIHFDPQFLELVQDRQYVLTASSQNSVSSILLWAQKQIDICIRAGLKKEQIILDPGIGFAKSPIETFQILKQLDLMQSLGVELLVGHSRKPFWRICLPESTENSDFSSCIVASQLKGIGYLRVHNVKAHHHAMVLSQMMLGK